MSPAEQLRAIAAALDSGASLESQESAAEQVFGLRFKIDHTEKKIRARVAAQRIDASGGTEEEAFRYICEHYGYAHAKPTAWKVVKGQLSTAITDEARRRRDAAMPDVQNFGHDVQNSGRRRRSAKPASSDQQQD